MKLANPYPVPAFIFQQYNNRAELIAVITAKATYEISTPCELTFLKEQPEILLVDEYTGPETPPAHLVRQADFIPFKPATDVTVLARAFSPTRKPQNSWVCSIKVAGREVALQVHGPRFWSWSEEGGTWELGSAESVPDVALSYYKSFGGATHQSKNDVRPFDCHRFNPIGPGVLNEYSRENGKKFSAPQIESPNDPIVDWKRDYVPRGLAPIAPVWRFREQYTGTYDKTWLETRHPFLPPDFDYRFYNCAHPDLVFSPYLTGGESVTLSHLHPHFSSIELTLPKLILSAAAEYENEHHQEQKFLVLDGVHFDLLRPGKPHLTMTWRTHFSWRDGISVISLDAVKNGASSEKKAKPLSEREVVV